ncbi:DB domain-containing protein, partial [Trichostrongylus colubriformis]
MIPHSIILLAVVLISSNGSDDVVLVEGHQPYRPYRALRSQRKERDLKVHSHDSIQNIIYAPFDGERIITKGIFYVNGKSQRDDQIYNSMLEEGVKDMEALDAFYVTPPPLRTTVPVKFVDIDSLTARQRMDEADLQQVETQGTTRSRPPLRLVTIPPTSSTPLPPFKHVRRPVKRPQEDPISSSAHTNTEEPSTAVPWHMASLQPFPPLFPGLLNPLQDQLTSPPPFIPPNPFVPITPVSELNITYPFVPIGNSDMRPPPFSPPALTPYTSPQGQQEPVHRSSFRRGSFNRNRNVPAISLATAAGIVGGDAYVDSTRLQYSKKPSSDIDFSIDDRPVIVAQDRVPPQRAQAARRQLRPRSISEPYREDRIQGDPNQRLRLFAQNHPTFLYSMGTRPPFKETEVVPFKA